MTDCCVRTGRVRRTRELATLLSAVALAVVGVCPRAAFAEPPTDAEVFAVVRNIQREYAALEQEDFRAAKVAFRRMIVDAAGSLDLSELTPYQISLIGPMLDKSGLDHDQSEALTISLERAAEDSIHGATALLLLHSLRYRDAPESHPYLERFLDHPGRDGVMNSSLGPKALNSFSLKPDLMVRFGDRVEDAIQAIRPHAYESAVVRPIMARLLDACEAVEQERPGMRARVHRHLLDLTRTTHGMYAPRGGHSYDVDRPRIKSSLDALEYLESIGRSGTIIGEAAPGLSFEWSAGPQSEAASLSDLRGKVVVLDFWATWCGPCVASFPEVRELRAAYEQVDLAIVGLTSLQGFHVPRDGRPAKDLEPERERALMGEYLEKNDISWTVAFSDRSVIDPRYGVWGIPHVVVIDRAGVVRLNGLEEGMSVASPEFRALLDELIGG